jgi:hypothetical protein
MATNAMTDLREFRDFVSRQIERARFAPTPEECLLLWREWRETNDGIREGLSQLDAGLGKPLDEVLTIFRDRNGLPPAVRE